MQLNSNNSAGPAMGSLHADSSDAPAASSTSSDHLRILRGLIELSQHSQAEVARFLYNTRRCEALPASSAELAQKQDEVIAWVHDNWKAVEEEITRLKGNKWL